MGRELPPVINEGASGEITTGLTLLAFVRTLFALDFVKGAFDERPLGITLLGAHAGSIQQCNATGDTRQNETNAPINDQTQGQ